jgi:hypothetical protein
MQLMARRREVLQILRGLVGTILINTIAGVALVMLYSVSFLFNVLLWAIGLTQFIYLIPLLVFLGFQERWGLIKGIWLGALLTALVNISYYAYSLFLVMKR